MASGVLGRPLHLRELGFQRRERRGGVRASTAAQGVPSPDSHVKRIPGKLEADVVVIGSGIGGLCCAGLLAKYGQDVLVLESHDLPGGAAHSFEVKGFKFDSGPSLFSGFQSRGLQANPLAQVLDALDESVQCASYNSWMVYVPEGVSFSSTSRRRLSGASRRRLTGVSSRRSPLTLVTSPAPPPVIASTAARCHRPTPASHFTSPVARCPSHVSTAAARLTSSPGASPSPSPVARCPSHVFTRR
ncbi:Prolycopene isomerase 2 [Nymphaea thermarum]|nr:Prolycopene isomerase 2 [Nymphaea thermarum]